MNKNRIFFTIPDIPAYQPYFFDFKEDRHPEELVRHLASSGMPEDDYIVKMSYLAGNNKTVTAETTLLKLRYAADTYRKVIAGENMFNGFWAIDIGI